MNFVSGPEARDIKEIKNLLTLTKKSEIKIQFANLPLGMYLIPMYLSITSAYVIIALQFNNII